MAEDVIADRQQFAEAARHLAALVGSLPEDGWDGPGLGEWTLRSLVGHTSRALLTVETYLDQPAASVEVADAADYLTRGTAARVDHHQVAARGVAAGLALGDRPAETVERLVDRVVPLVERAGDPVITTVAGGMRLSAYLPTRTFELVVHGYDIARAAALAPPAYGTALLASVAALAATAAARAGRGEQLILALTGRTGLPAGFSVT